MTQLRKILCLGAVALALLLFPSLAAAQITPTWSVTHIEINGQLGLNGVSCPWSAFCVAVDAHGNAFIYDGFRWTSQNIDGSTGLDSVSCASPTFCVAGDALARILVFDGFTWSAPKQIESTGGAPILSVSCASATFCVAGDAIGNVMTYNGSSWSAPFTLDPAVLGQTTPAEGSVQGVSCPAPGWCIAVDSNGKAYTGSGSSWSKPFTVNANAFLFGVSCGSPTFCVAVDFNFGAVYTYTGSWSGPNNIDNHANPSLLAISCASPTFCVAVDPYGNALTYNGSSWSASLIDSSPGAGGLQAVSCPSSTFCAAVDFAGNAPIYSPAFTLGKIVDQPMISAGPHTLTYTLAAVNRGPLGLTGVTVNDSLPANASLVGATSTQGSCSMTQTVVCNIGPLAAGTAARITIIVSANWSPGKITNTATAAANEFPATSSSNMVTTIVRSASDLSIVKTASLAALRIVGDTLAYTLSVQNNGPSDALNVEVTDNLPPHINLQAVTWAQGGCYGRQSIVCNLGLVASGSSASITITVVPLPGSDPTGAGAIFNTASVMGPFNDDPIAFNNSSSVNVSCSYCFQKLTTKMTLTGSPNPSTQGQTVVFKATLTTTGSFPPGGSVTFSEAGVVLAQSVPLNASDSASYSTSSLAQGTHNITATYSGDPHYLGSSAGWAQTVNASGGGGGGRAGAPATELVLVARPLGPVGPPSFAVIDFTNPISPTIVNPNPPYLGGSVVDCSGARAALGNQNGGQVVIYDLSNPASPAKLGSINTVLSGIGAIKLDGNRVLVGEMDGFRVEWIDISNPSSPVVLSTLHTGIGSIGSVALSGSKAVVSGPNNITMDIIDYTDPANRTRSSFDPKIVTGLPGLTVDLDGNLAAVGTQYNSQIALVDINGPSVLGTVSSGLSGVAGAQNLSISVKGSQVAVGSSNYQNVALIDFSNPSSPVVSDFDPDPNVSSGWTVSRTPGLLAISEINGSDVELFSLSPQNSATFLGKANSNVASPSTICILEINANTTPVGNNVAVQPKDSTGKSPVTVTFPAVTQAGQTSLTISNSGPVPPVNFKLGSPATYYDLTTTALFTPPATVCFSYAGVQYSEPSSIQLFHNVNGSWGAPITTFNDTVNQILCGTVNSFSPFAVFQPLPVLTITANSASRQYGAADLTFTASYSGFVNGDGPATLSGQLSCKSNSTPSSPVGSYTIDCSSSTLSSSNYTIAYATGVLTVTPAPLTITANNATKVYGTALPTLGFTASGFVNGDTVASLTTQPTLSTTATGASGVGSYLITIGGAVNANYSITYVQGMLTVTPAPVTITADNVTKVLNAANPALTWTPSGFVGGDTVNVLTVNPTCNTTANTNSPIGSYPITCSGASAANYTFSYVAGTLKIQYATAIGHVIQPPISADGTSVFNQGRTIPAKFSVYDANGVSIGTPGVGASFFLTGIQSGTAVTPVQDVVNTNNPDSSFRWDPIGQQWIFNISTGGLTSGNTYIYTIMLNDGTTIMFQYGLR